jgi:hypothetical protein
MTLAAGNNAATQHHQLNHKIHTVGHNRAEYGARKIHNKPLTIANNKCLCSNLSKINKTDTNVFFGANLGIHDKFLKQYDIKQTQTSTLS